jgi:gliding motility-associated-like protein
LLDNGSANNFNRIGFNGVTGYLNFIYHNSLNGIRLDNGNNNSWCKNSIYDNGGLGIEISNTIGPNTNDPGDTDSGPNDALNHPDLLQVHHCGSSTNMSARYDGIAGQAYRIDFYKMDPADVDASGYGEGPIYLGGVEFVSTGIDTVYYAYPSLFVLGYGVTAIATQKVGVNPQISSEFAQVIFVDGPVSVAPASTDASCNTSSDGTVSVSVAGTPAVISYEWTDFNTGLGIGNSSAQSVPAGTYFCTFVTLSGCTITTSNLIVNTIGNVDAGFTLPSNACSGVPLTMVDTSIVSGGTPTYNWNAFDGTNTMTGTNQNQVFTFSAGTYSITLSVFITGCVDSVTQTFTVSPSPDATFSHDTSYCLLLPKDTLIPATSGGTFTGNGVNAMGVFDPFSVGPGTANIITYTVTTGSCTSQHTDTIYVYPYTPSNITGLNGSYCVGAPLDTIYVTPSGGTLSIDSVAVTLVNGSYYVFDPNSITGGGASFTYLYFDGFGCPSFAAGSTNIYPVPAQPTSTNTVYDICASAGNQTITVTAQGGNSLFWYTDTTFTTFFTIGSTVNSSSLSGFNHFWVAENNGACISVPLEIDINVYDGSFVNVVSPIAICAGETASLQASSSFTGIYQWTGDSTIVNPGNAITTAHPVVSTSYQVSLTATVAGMNCAMFDSVLVFVDFSGDCGLEIVNAFSPNNDGVNDTWHIEAVTGQPNNIVYVFNRWGSRMVKIENYNNTDNAWNGEYKGVLVPQGTYYYIVELPDISRQYAGWVQVNY